MAPLGWVPLVEDWGRCWMVLMILILITGCRFCECVSGAPKTFPDVLTYFPEVNGDACLVTWAHGANSWDLLNHAIDENAMMIEGDIWIGQVTGESRQMIPIMAHPPATFSNISLDSWLDHLLSSGLRTGMKLDFKSIAIVEESLKILQKFRDELNCPLWLNADILAGPMNASASPLDPERFIQLCHHHFPGSVLSLGWTTNNVPNDHVLPAYTWHHVITMDKILIKHHVSQRVTFPVRAVFLKTSYQPLKWLTDVGNVRTLTIWTGADDEVAASDLLEVRSGFDKRSVYYDLPLPLRDHFWFVRDKVTLPLLGSTRPEKISPRTWVIEERDCARTGAEAIVFYGNCLTLYMDKFMGTVDFPVTIMGEIEFLDTDAAGHEDGLAIGLRAQPWLWVYISANGSINYPTGGYQKDVTPGLPANRCYRFNIVDSGGSHPVKLTVWSLPCWPQETSIKEEGASSTVDVEIPKTLDSTIQLAFSSKGEGTKVVHSFKIYVPSSGVLPKALCFEIQLFVAGFLTFWMKRYHF